MENVDEEVVESKKGITGSNEGKRTIFVPGELEARTERGVTVAAGTVYDYKQKKFQQDINEGLQQLTDDINQNVKHTLSEHSGEIENINEALEENIPYVIVYENQTINIPCDPYGNYAGSEQEIGTVVKLYRGNIQKKIEYDNSIVIESPTDKNFNTEVIEDDGSAIISIPYVDISNLDDTTEVDFYILSQGKGYYGKVIFNKVKRGKSAYEEWKDKHPEIVNPSIDLFLAELKNTDNIKGPKYLENETAKANLPLNEDALNTIYFVPQIDSQTNISDTYKIYLLDSDSYWRYLATRPGDITNYAGIYDVSEDNKTDNTPKSYSGLSGAITDIVAKGVSKGGMTIKYKDSNGKYHQYRYTLADTTGNNFTNEANWEEISGIAGAIDRLAENSDTVMNTLGMIEVVDVCTVTSDSAISTYSYPIHTGDKFIVKPTIGSGVAYVNLATRKNGVIVEYLLYQVTTNNEVVFTALEDAEEFVFYSSRGSSSISVKQINKTGIAKRVTESDMQLVEGVWFDKSNGVFVSHTGSQFGFLPLSGYDYVRIEGIGNSTIAFVTSNSTSGSISYSTKYPDFITVGAHTETYPIPQDAAYLIVAITYSGLVFYIPKSIELTIGTPVLCRLNEIEEQFETKLSKFVKSNWTINNQTTYLTNNLGFEVGKRYRIRLEIPTALTGNLAIFLAPNASSIATNERIGTLFAGETYTDFTYTPPAAKNYQYMYIWNNESATTATLRIWEFGKIDLQDELQEIQKEVDLIKLVPDYTATNPKSVDLGNYTTATGALGTNKVWTTGAGASHKAIPVTGGDKFVISGDGSNAWGWVTSSYNPPYNNNAPIPYVTGYDRRFSVSGEATVQTAPEGAAYLIVGTVNGAGTPGTWNIIKIGSYAYKNKSNFVKFRFATWNIGRFVYYNYHTTRETSDISDDNADAYALDYKKIINTTGADILGICEYETKYPRHTSSDSARNVIFSCYKQAIIGTYIQASSCNAVFMNSPQYISKSEKIFDHTVKNDGIYTDEAQRYYIDVLCEIGGKEVHIVETHLDWRDDSIRALQIQELVNTMSVYPYVIIGGDFNTNKETIENEMEPFLSAGFNVANGGYIGSFVTHEERNNKFDNIVTKGFAMSNIKVDENAGNYSDHWIVSCDLEMLNI